MVGFYSIALERQVAEGVKIESSGAEKLLNSKAAYRRNKIPRIVALDSTEVENLGDRKCIMEEISTNEMVDDTENEEVILTGENLRKSQDRKRRKDRLVDHLHWGQGPKLVNEEDDFAWSPNPLSGGSSGNGRGS